MSMWIATYAMGFHDLHVAYVQRLNRVADVFVPLLALIQQEQAARNPEGDLID
ncbi:hypothetical protein [Nitrosomonas communis]|uniref:hypothetical protein n=1 Tax=Nitrosomonas communis TaxID=44574 RepID=UPI003D28E2D9